MLIIEERPEKCFVTFLLRPSLDAGLGTQTQLGATLWVNLCSVLERVVATWMDVNILSLKQIMSAWVWKALSFQREIFLHFIALLLVLCSDILLSSLHALHSPIPQVPQLFLLFSLDSSFEHHPMSNLPSLPQYFVSTVNFHTLFSSYKIRPSIWHIIPGSEVSKTWNKTTKCGTASPEGSDDMHVHAAAQAFWLFRRGSKETCHFLAVLALVVWCYPGAGLNVHLKVSLKFLTLAGDLVPWWPVCSLLEVIWSCLSSCTARSSPRAAQFDSVH